MNDTASGEEEKIHKFKTIKLPRQAEKEYNTRPGREPLGMYNNNKEGTVSTNLNRV